ncbi:MAG: DUF4270 domain-containing protein [Muribaculaceae bacterium]|nr:DUF4270 domain-containing protein [Muribaculaceae bacterium]
MKKSFFALSIAVAALLALWACDDNTSTIGSSLTGQNVEIIIDSSFQAQGRTVMVSRIRPKTTQVLIGRIDIPAYGRLETSNVMQFLPSTELDTANFGPENVDSLVLTLRYARGSFMGDSVAPMGLTVHRLKDMLSDTISSGFDPAGTYESTPLASTIYNTSTFNGTSAEQTATYRDITLTLDRGGKLGRDLFKAFVDHPDYYADGNSFASNVFKGIYMGTNYGSGRMTLVSVTSMQMHMRKIYIPTDSVTPDTLDAVHTYYLVTPEVIANNNLRYEMADGLKQLIADGHTLMVAPAGSELELTFPLPDIIAAYRSHQNSTPVANTLTFEIPVDTIENGFGITPPPYVLLVLKKDRDEFFAKNKLTDNVSSFYAAYNSTKQCYSFTGMRAYLTDMLEREEIKPEDYTFSLVPVQVNFENLAGGSSYYYGTTSQTESEILPYLVSPVMADIRVDKAKIKFSYSLQTQK